MTRNLGIGLGGVAGGLIATTSDPSSFTVLFLVDAATFLAFVVALTFVPEPAVEREERPAGPERTSTSYGIVCSSRSSR